MLDSLVLGKLLTLPMILWCLFLYLIIVCGNWRYNVTLYGNPKYYGRLKGGRTTWIFFCFFLFVLTWWLNTDYYGYANYAQFGDVDFNFNPLLELEVGGQFIASIVNGDWLGFRVGVWGTALILFVLTLRRFELNVQHGLFILFLMYYNIFCYGRVTLAMAIYFYGLSFLCKPLKNNLFSIIIGVLLIYCCHFFHRSAILMIVLTPMLFFASFRKWFKTNRYMILLLFVILMGIVVGIEGLYSIGGLDDKTQHKLEMYEQREMAKANILGVIGEIIDYTSYILPNIVLIYYLFKLRKGVLPLYITRLMIVGLSIFVTSIAFYFSGEGQFTLFYRVLFMTMIPVSLVLTYMHTEGIISRKNLILIFLPALLRTFYTFLPAIVNSLESGGVRIIDR